MGGGVSGAVERACVCASQEVLPLPVLSFPVRGSCMALALWMVSTQTVLISVLPCDLVPFLLLLFKLFFC